MTNEELLLRLREMTLEADGFVLLYSTQPSSTRYYVGAYRDKTGMYMEFRLPYGKLMELVVELMV